METNNPASLPSVVLVDDDSDDLFCLQRILLRMGLKNPLVTFNCAQTAISFLDGSAHSQSARPLAVISDLNMPGMRGLDLVKWIRRQRQLDGIPVAIVTSSSHADDRQAAMDAGADIYFTKYPGGHELMSFLCGGEAHTARPLTGSAGDRGDLEQRR